MAHEGIVIFLLFLGSVLIAAYLLGPGREVRKVRRTEAKVMLVPSGAILIVLAAILFSGILG